MGGKWTQGGGKRGQREESGGEGGSGDTVYTTTLLVMSDIKPRIILGSALLPNLLFRGLCQMEHKGCPFICNCN